VAVASAGPYANLHLDTTTPASHHSVFTGQKPFLPPNQQCQSTESILDTKQVILKMLFLAKLLAVS